MLLLLQQGLLAIDAEQTIEGALLPLQPIELQRQNRLNFAMAIQPLLMGQGQFGQRDKRQGQANCLQAKAQKGKQELFAGDRC